MAKYKSHSPAFLWSDVFIFCHGLPHNRGDFYLSQACSKLLSPIYPSFFRYEVSLGSRTFVLVRSLRVQNPQKKAVVTYKRRQEVSPSTARLRQQTIEFSTLIITPHCFNHRRSPMSSWGLVCSPQTPCKFAIRLDGVL